MECVSSGESHKESYPQRERQGTMTPRRRLPMGELMLSSKFLSERGIPASCRERVPRSLGERQKSTIHFTWLWKTTQRTRVLAGVFQAMLVVAVIGARTAMKGFSPRVCAERSQGTLRAYASRCGQGALLCLWSCRLQKSTPTIVTSFPASASAKRRAWQ